MTTEAPPAAALDVIEVDLRDPIVAAVLAWLWPGAGHLYQRRYAKGVLYMVCILGTFFFGLALSDGKAVYAAWTDDAPVGAPAWKGIVTRAHYLCQLGVGAPALPAIVQKYRVSHGKAPLFGGVMAPPEQSPFPNAPDQLSQWHESYHKYWELSTLYTMVAGLLNILAIYDAFAGPVLPAPKEEDESPGGDEKT
ncbi:MAG: hypothetical protein KY475_22050 [Planctomycetes bacterium]|nr:hypothetical protein [Planctomycetota bacterium]